VSITITTTPSTLPRLPDAVINEAKSDPAKQQETIAGRNTLIPVVYGRARLGARIFFVGKIGTDLVLGGLWALGEVQTVESVTINGEAPPAGVTVTSYVGATSQTPDATLVAAATEAGAAYADALVTTYEGVTIGVAYSVIRVQAGAITGFPRIEAVIQGRKVYDPRTTTTGYSRNPALCLADWLTSRVYGQGRAVDWTTVTTAANFCDALLADETPRRQLDLAIDNDLPVAQWADVLATYAGCAIAHDGASLDLIPLTTVDLGTAATVTATDVVAESLVLRRPSVRDRPTVVKVGYTDTTVTPWAIDYQVAEAAGVADGSLERRVESVDMQGIIRPAQAYREALERLNSATLTDLTAEWLAFDEGLRFLVGDVVKVTHSGLVAMPFRVRDVQLDSPGRWRVSATRYDALVYSDTVVAPLREPYTPLPSPRAIPALTGLTCASGTEYLLLQDDGTVVSRIRVTWDAPAYLYTDVIDVQYKLATGTLWRRHVGADEVYLAPVQDGTTYDIRARIRNALGYFGPWVTMQHVVVGKTAAPPPPTDFRVSTASDGTRVFVWQPPADPPVDLAGYRLRYASGTGATWANMALLHGGSLTVTEWETIKLAAGTYTFALACIDTSGNLSDPVYIEATLADPRMGDLIRIIVDSGAAGWPGTITNGVIDAVTGWLVATDTKTWASLGTDGVTWATWTGWARDANDLTYEEDPIDCGKVTTFVPLVTADAVGTVTAQMATSNDGATYSSWTSLGVATARYVKLKVQVTGAAGVQIALKGLLLEVNSNLIEEDHQDLAIATLTGSYRIGTGNVRLPLRSVYSQITHVGVTLQNVGAGWSWELVDKQTTYGPQIKVYNASNALADCTIDALIRGL
jgi:hypothetical protein